MIIRAVHNRENPYFLVLRATAQDINLSARALGVLVYLMSKPDSWEPSISDICSRFSDIGRDQAYKIINEVFVPLRYARRVQERQKGKVSRWVTEIYEAPLPEDQEVEITENQENPEGREFTENQEESEGSPLPENQEVEPVPDYHFLKTRNIDINRIINTELLQEENTEQQQQAGSERSERTAAAAATDFQEPHLSRFPFSSVENFVKATKRHSTNPGGLARKLWRTGEEDGQIAEFFDEREEREQLEEQIRDAAIETASDFDMGAWIDELIANNWIPQLENERGGIIERGGPKLDWEFRVIAYFNNQPVAEGGRPNADDGLSDSNAG